jgi:hypothetical protein
MPRLDGADVLVVDLDGTLLRVNSFPVFVRFLLYRLVCEGRLVTLTRVVAALGRRKIMRGEHARLKAVVCDACSHLDAHNIARWADGIVRRHARPEIVVQARTWPGPVVLCTSAPEGYARAIGEACGCDFVQGSRVLDGRLVQNVGTEKARRLSELVTGSVELVISDDRDLDGPLLALGRRKLLVG